MVIYAGFAIVIVALIWLYVSWLILLLGAQLAFYVQNPQYLRPGRGEIQLNASLRERVALSIMYLIVSDYRHCATSLDHQPPRRASGPAGRGARARSSLRWSAPSCCCSRDDDTWVPARDPHMHRARRRARRGAARHRRAAGSGRIRDIAPAVEAARARGGGAEAKSLKGKTVSDLVEKESTS